jgi:hypothetical protein
MRILPVASILLALGHSLVGQALGGLFHDLYESQSLRTLLSMSLPSGSCWAPAELTQRRWQMPKSKS